MCAVYEYCGKPLLVHHTAIQLRYVKSEKIRNENTEIKQHCNQKIRNEKFNLKKAMDTTF